MFYFYFIHASLALWVRALVSGARVSLFDIAFLKLEKVGPDVIKGIVEKIIDASKAGLHIDLADMGGLFMAGGDVDNVLQAMVEAYSAKIDLPLEKAVAVELAGRDVLEAVRMSIKPQVLETPEITALARDGIQLKVRCSVTVRADIDRFLGGVGRETILARVGTGIVSAVGSAASHRDIEQEPALIGDLILDMDKDRDDMSDIHQDSAFTVISIDASNVLVGENIIASLQAQRANADTVKARAVSEMYRAEYVTLDEDRKAKIYEMQAERIDSEAKVKLAIADAVRNRKMSVTDYLKMKNLTADTRMRESFAAMGQPPGPPKSEDK